MEGKDFTKYVIQADEGYFYRITPPGQVFSGITPAVQDASIFEFPTETSVGELEESMVVKWLYADVKRDGGSNPKLIPVSISERAVD